MQQNFARFAEDGKGKNTEEIRVLFLLVDLFRMQKGTIKYF